MPKKDKDKAKTGEVRLDPPSIALLPGNTATFVADAPEGLGLVTIKAGASSWTGAPSVGSGEARISKIIETGHTDLIVSFTDDGKEYATGTFSVE